MRRGQRLIGTYGWPDVERELSMGVNPDVVAARFHETTDYVLEVAARQGWPVTWKGPTADDVTMANRLDWILDS